MNEEYQFDRADRLRLRLINELKTNDDVLGNFRKWLEINGINPETDGFPSEEAYLNVDNYIKELAPPTT